MGDGWSVETLDKCRKFYRVYSSRQISSTMQTKLTAGVGFAKTKDGGTKRMSLFGIMVSQRENIYVNSTFADRINESVLIVNSTAPFAIGSLQKFRFANTRKWMLLNICQQGSDTFQNASVGFAFPIL